MRSRSVAVLVALTASLLVAIPVACNSDQGPQKSHLFDQDTSPPPDTSVPYFDAPPGDTFVAEAGDAAPDAGPVCDPSATFQAGSLVEGSDGGLGSGGTDWLGSVTPDELSIAWMSGSDPNGVLYYSDRASTAVPFGDPRIVASSVVTVATDRVALTPDGLGLAVVLSSRRGLTRLTRSTRSDPFDNPISNEFASINTLASEAPPEQMIGDPLYSSDGSTFVYSYYGGDPLDGGLDSTIRIASRPSSNDPWATGDVQYQAELQVTNQGARRRPSGYSADGLTLFYWDESTLSEKAAWRVDTSSTFTKFVDLGLRIFAQPTGDCTRLYYSDGITDAGGLDASDDAALPPLQLFSAKKN